MALAMMPITFSQVSAGLHGHWLSQHKSFYIDLTGDAVIRCRVRNSGMRNLFIIIQSASGNWFVSDQCSWAIVGLASA